MFNGKIKKKNSGILNYQKKDKQEVLDEICKAYKNR